MRVKSALTLIASLLLAPALGLAAEPAALSPSARADAPAAPTVAAPAPAPAMDGPVQHVDARVAEAAATAAPVTGKEAFFKAAVWPGILWHGAGYAYAGDNDMALGLTGMQGFAVFVGGFSLYTLGAATKQPGDAIDTTQALGWTGAALFVTGWAWDMIGAPRAAEARGSAPKVSLLPAPYGAQLALRF